MKGVGSFAVVAGTFGGASVVEIFSTIGVEKCCTVGVEDFCTVAVVVICTVGVEACRTAGVVGKGICWTATDAENQQILNQGERVNV